MYRRLQNSLAKVVSVQISIQYQIVPRIITMNQVSSIMKVINK